LIKAHMTDLGRLSQETGSHQWRGDISLDNRIKNGELTNAEVEEAVSAVREFYVPTTKGAAIRCIDGRTVRGYDDNDPAQYGRALGPQVPGGSPADGVAWRLAIGDQRSPFQSARLGEDIARFAEVAVDAGFIAGGHSDEDAGYGRSGCGAIDGIEEVLGTFNPSRINDLEKLTNY
jgi:hypothetical protein